MATFRVSAIPSELSIAEYRGMSLASLLIGIFRQRGTVELHTELDEAVSALRVRSAFSSSDTIRIADPAIYKTKICGGINATERDYLTKMLLIQTENGSTMSFHHFNGDTDATTAKMRPREFRRWELPFHGLAMVANVEAITDTERTNTVNALQDYVCWACRWCDVDARQAHAIGFAPCGPVIRTGA
jgi:hypothetical protein